MAEEQNRAWNDRYMLRLPDGLRDRIKAAAEMRGRSMNAEIVRVLERAFPPPRLNPLDEMARDVSAITESLMIETGQTSPSQVEEAALVKRAMALWAEATNAGKPLPIRSDITGGYQVKIAMPRRERPDDP